VLLHSQTEHESADSNVPLLHLEGNCALQRTKKSMSYPMVTKMLKHFFPEVQELLKSFCLHVSSTKKDNVTCNFCNSALIHIVA